MQQNTPRPDYVADDSSARRARRTREGVQVLSEMQRTDRLSALADVLNARNRGDRRAADRRDRARRRRAARVPH